jgi:hypothetical protein
MRRARRSPSAHPGADADIQWDAGGMQARRRNAADALDAPGWVKPSTSQKLAPASAPGRLALYRGGSQKIPRM